MSTDRELLELAAKAFFGKDVVFGITVKSVHGDDIYPNGKLWNPLTDDGDALRLAVKLVIDIRPPRSEDDDALAAGQDERGFFESQKRDPYAATRRAIVRAAAAIAKEMKE